MLQMHGIVLTMFDRRNNLSEQVATDVRSFMGDRVYDTIIPRNVRVSEAPGYGQSVLTYDPGSRGSTSYVEAARQLAERGVSLPPLDRAGSPAATTAPPVAAMAVSDGGEQHHHP